MITWTWIGVAHKVGLTDLTDEEVRRYEAKFYGAMTFFEALSSVMADPNIVIGDPHPFIPRYNIETEDEVMRLTHFEYIFRILWLEDSSTPVYRALQFNFVRRIALMHVKHQMSKMSYKIS